MGVSYILRIRKVQRWDTSLYADSTGSAQNTGQQGPAGASRGGVLSLSGSGTWSSERARARSAVIPAEGQGCISNTFRRFYGQCLQISTLTDAMLQLPGDWP